MGGCFPVRYLNPELFANIVRHARETNPFYRRWIPENGPAPILTRRVLQENNDEILNGHPATVRTSGSTGTPVRIHMTAARKQLNAPGAKLLARHLGGALQQIALISDHGRQGELIVSVHTPIPEQLEILRQGHRERKVAAVITYPSNAELLSQEILKEGLDFSFIRRLGLMAETIDPGQIALFRQAFPKAKIWSNYSSMEFGLISFQCPYEPEFHHATIRKLGIEILDDDGRDCEPGQLGRLVITDYFNRASPLIRYEIGDLAEFGGECPCGRIALPTLKNILGKARGCFLLRNGRRIPYIDLSVALRDLPGMRQYQVIQEEVERFTVKVVSEHRLDAPIEQAFARALGYSPRIDIETMDSIPRDPSGKFFICLSKV